MGGIHRTKSFIFSHKKLLIILVIIIAIIGFVISSSQASEPLETYKVKRGNITEALTATGMVGSLSSADLNFLAPGKLVYLGAKKGDMVNQGQTIAVLDQRTMQKNLEIALREYSKQRNVFEQTKDDNNSDEIEDALNDEMKRILENNQHDLDKAVHSVELQSLAKEQSVLTTPISGVVTRSDVTTPGVNVGVTTTFSIADPNQLVFKMEVDEADVGRVSVGQPVKIVLDAYPEETIDTSVETIDFASHTTSTGGNVFTVESRLIPTGNIEYRIGMGGDAEIIMKENNDVIVIPIGSLTDDEAVYIQTKEGAYKKKKVKIGAQSDINIEVIDGLKEGDVIALDPGKAAEVGENKKKFIFF